MRWSLRRALRAFVRPRDAFDGASPPVKLGIAVVLLVCVLNAAVALYSAGLVAESTTGTVTIENPQRPPEWVCEDPDEGSLFAERCANEPRTVDVEFATHARQAANDVVLYAAFAPLAVWFAVSGLLHLVVGGATSSRREDRVSFLAVLGVTGLGFAPAALRYLVRGSEVRRSLAGTTLDPSTADAARTLARDAMLPDSTLYALAVVATVAWSGYVWWGGWTAAFDVEDSRPAVVAAASAGVLALPAVAPVLVSPQVGLAGLLLVLFGVPGLAIPRRLERLDVAFDLVGTRGGENVEIRPWRVALAQLTGLGMVVVGALLVGGLYVA